MNKTNNQTDYWNYLTGDFLNRIQSPLRKVLPTLTRRITEMFNYAG